MDAVDKLLNEVNNKPTWSSKELYSKLISLKNSLFLEMQSKGTVEISKSAKRINVSLIKKYDIVYVPMNGIPHFVLVYKVSNDRVVGITITSKDKVHSIHQIKKDRFFEENYATNSFITLPLDECFKSFVRVYESKQEADMIFNKVIDYLNEILSNKSKIFKSHITKKIELTDEPSVLNENILPETDDLIS